MRRPTLPSGFLARLRCPGSGFVPIAPLSGARLRRSLVAVLILIVLLVPASLPAQARFPALTLLDQDPPNYAGVRYFGDRGARLSGASICDAGDVDGDGWPDLAISATARSGGGPGRVWVVFGGRPFPRSTPLDALATQGFAVASGLAEADGFGTIVASAGDIDGDGYDDLLIGAQRLPGRASGGVALLFGAGSSADLALTGAADRFTVFFSSDPADGALGRSASAAGDLDGDGWPDIAIGAPGALTGAAGGGQRLGRVWVLRGGPQLRGRSGLDFDLSALPADLGFALTGPEADADFGAALGPAGDIDDDGRDDLLIGAPRADIAGPGSDDGILWIIFGHDGVGPIDWAAPEGVVHRGLSGPAGALFGHAFAGGTDVDGDQIDDLIVGAPAASFGEAAGAAYFIRGGAHVRAAAKVAELGSTVLIGSPRSATGTAVAFVPDVDGDGIAELLIGAPGRDSGLGSAYLVYGQPDLGAAIRLESLRPDLVPFGARFFQNDPGARLGAAVAGFPDRFGLRRGGFAIAAPEAGVVAPGAGVVYEVAAKPPQDAPRGLTCSVLPGARVQLDWHNPAAFEFLSIFRNGERIAGPLPGRLTGFYDTDPPDGLAEYFVEADGSPTQRSGACRVLVRTVGLQDLRCEQLPGSTRVDVRWVNGDRYDRIAVFLGDELAAELPGFADRYTFDRGAGLFEVRVVAEPGGHVARCAVEVSDIVLPPIRDLECQVEAPRDVRLTWRADPIYDAYDVRRDGVRIARTSEPTYLDEVVPSGSRSYAVSGLISERHSGPAAFCNALVGAVGGSVVRGRVHFDDGAGTPLASGRIELRDARGIVARGQVDGAGAFELAAPDRGPFQLVFTLALEPIAAGDALLIAASGLVASARDVAAGDDVELLVPIPTLAVASLRSDTEHWRALALALGEKRLFYAAALPAGVGRAARALVDAMEAIGADLDDQLGRAPEQCDVVAFGSSGLAARLALHAGSGPRIRRLVLMGTPNLGTPRALRELRRDLARRPLPRGADTAAHAAASEQVAEFLDSFNARIRNTHGADVHLIAGTDGDDELDAVLGCDLHDGRTCVDSAHGVVADATTHVIGEDHAALGRGARSLDLLETIGADRPEGAGARAADGDGGGAGAADAASSQAASRYDGVLLPGDDADIPLHSDTSGSIIIILNSELPGAILFRIETPTGALVDPANAAGLGIGYVTYSEGEGQIIQSYHFPAGAAGTYTAQLASGAATAIEYELELWVESSLVLDTALGAAEVDPGESTTLTATLTDDGQPVTSATVDARIWRPDGALELARLADDGVLPDATAADGIWTTMIPGNTNPGFHVIEIEAIGAGGSFTRTATLQLVVRSDAGLLGDVWTSGIEDADADGLPDGIWLDGTVDAQRPATFLVLATLEDANGSLVDEAGSFVDAPSAGIESVRIRFDGADLFAAQLDGPYNVATIELIDVSVGFAPAHRLIDAHQTTDYSWRIFGVAPAVTAFRRGDPNADGATDITDAIFILLRLFDGGAAPSCAASADANADDRLDLSDAIYVLEFLFTGGARPPFPFPACAELEGADCASYPPCN